MSFRCFLRRPLVSHLFTQGWHQRSARTLTRGSTLLRNIRSSVFCLKTTEKARWTLTFGLRHGSILIAAAFAVVQLDDETKKQKDEDSELIKSIKLAVLSLQKGEPDKAERILHLSLRVAQEQANGPAITYIYDLLANIAFEQRNFTKAERLLNELLRRLAADATDSNAFVEVSLKLASVFASSGDTERAEAGFQFCIDTQRQKISAAGGEAATDADTLGLWGMSVDWYARFLRSQRQYSRARELTSQALAACVRVSGELAEQSVVLLSDLGTLDLLCGDTDSAAARLETAVRLATELGLPELPMFQVNLGVAKLQQGMVREANKACSAARRLATQNSDTETQNMANECLKKVKKLL